MRIRALSHYPEHATLRHPRRDAFWRNLIIAVLVAYMSAGCEPDTTVRSPDLTSTYDATNDIVAARENIDVLGDAVVQFLATPDETSRDSFQNAWIGAHTAYLRLTTGNTIAPNLATSIDPWPIEPGFIDSLPEYPDSGIISDTTIPITLDALREQHQFSDEAEVSLGFHIVEYYAFSREVDDLVSGGERNNRRRLMLAEVATALEQDIIDTTSILEISGAKPSPDQILKAIQTSIATVDMELRMPPDLRHGITSDTVYIGVLDRLEAIEGLMFEQTNIGDALGKANARLASDIRHNLRVLIQGFSQKQDFDQDYIQVLITGLNYQLREAITVLGRNRSTPDRDLSQP